MNEQNRELPTAPPSHIILMCSQGNSGVCRKEDSGGQEGGQSPAHVYKRHLSDMGALERAHIETQTLKRSQFS